MASSSSSSIINSVLDDLDLLARFVGGLLTKEGFMLKNLKTFVLWSTKLGDKNEDGILGSLLTKIQDAVSRNSQNVPPNFHDLDHSNAQYEDAYSLAKRIASDFRRDFQSINVEIDEWYIAASDNRRQSNSLTANEIGQIIESTWENLVDFLYFGRSGLAEPLRALREHLNFLKNFCHFATKRGVEDGQMKDLLTQTEAVAISAAR